MSQNIYSMTGFGHAEMQDADKKISVELKSVNHRYLEFTIKAPKKFSFLEAQIRSTLKEYMQRGKVDVFITWEDYTNADVTLKYNAALAEQYVAFARQMEQSFVLANDLTVTGLMACPDVLSEEDKQIDTEEIWKDLEPVLREAAESFRSARQKEGENLRRDLSGKLDYLAENVEKIIAREPQIMEDYRARLEEKTRELLSDSQVDESRIAAEVVIFADKICTDEETVRLKSHIQSMRDTLEIGSGIGRKLDFLAQEMNREANTILSKSNDIETSNIGVNLKTEIEKIREQVQNIE